MAFRIEAFLYNMFLHAYEIGYGRYKVLGINGRILVAQTHHLRDYMPR